MICPDCKQPVETHAMFRSGRCPVVIVRLPGLDAPPPAVYPRPIRACPNREPGQR